MMKPHAALLLATLILISGMLWAEPLRAEALPARALFAPVGAGSSTLSAPTLQEGLSDLPTAARGGNGLSGYLFFGPEQWSFWWQGQRVTPTQIPAGMSAITADPESLRFDYQGTAYHFTLGKFN